MHLAVVATGRQVAFDELRTRLSRDDSATVYLEYVTRTVPFLESEPSPSRATRARELQRILRLAAARGWQEVAAATEEPTVEFLATTQPFLDQALAGARLGIAAEEAMREAEHTLREVQTETQAVRARYELIAQELASLLTLPPPPSTSELSALRFYQSGVLAGLPVLQDLPDSLTPTALRDTLALLGGAVAISGTEVAERFAERVAALRSRSVEVAADRERLIGRANEAEQAQEQGRQDAAEALETTKLALVEALLRESAPPPLPLLALKEQVWNFFQSISST